MNTKFVEGNSVPDCVGQETVVQEVENTQKDLLDISYCELYDYKAHNKYTTTLQGIFYMYKYLQFFLLLLHRFHRLKLRYTYII